MALCLFCGEDRKLTQEHAFPAALGGITAPRVSCKDCNSALEVQFERYFVGQLMAHRHALRVKNSRTKKVPNVPATAQVGDFTVKLRLGGDHRAFAIDEDDDYQIKEVVREDGKKGWDILALTPRGLEAAKAEAAKLGAKRFTEGEWQRLTLEPFSRGSWDFVVNDRALRAATKVAIIGLAGTRKGLARLSSLEPARRYVRYGEGRNFARLFFNPEFTARFDGGPHQHAILYCFDFERSSIHAIVAFFGSLFYLVRLSDSARSADYGFTHAEDTLTRRVAPVIVSRFENEREAVRSIIESSTTRFDDVLSSARHYTEFMNKARKSEDFILTGRVQKVSK
jgi:hypothetical protein